MKITKFYSDPNRLVTDFETGKPLFAFDENGEHATMDKSLIKRLSTYFKCEEIELEVKTENNVPSEEIKKLKCKKCEFETDNKGELMAHHKAAHPKEGK